MVLIPNIINGNVHNAIDHIAFYHSITGSSLTGNSTETNIGQILISGGTFTSFIAIDSDVRNTYSATNTTSGGNAIFKMYIGSSPTFSENTIIDNFTIGDNNQQGPGGKAAASMNILEVGSNISGFENDIYVVVTADTNGNVGRRANASVKRINILGT